PAAPVITSFNATVLSGHMVSLTGTVADENPAGVQVMFSGVATGSATANAAGQFSLTTPASTLGTINAQARDTQMLWSQSKSSTITSNAPALTIRLTPGANHQVTVSGQVTDESPGGLPVAFGGVLAGSTTTNSTGAFCFTGTASNLGMITASTADVWGLHGTTSASLTNLVPVIEALTVTKLDDGRFVISGHVADDYAAGLIVRLTGLTEWGSGINVTVDATGHFSVTVSTVCGGIV